MFLLFTKPLNNQWSRFHEKLTHIKYHMVILAFFTTKFVMDYSVFNCHVNISWKSFRVMKWNERLNSCNISRDLVSHFEWQRLLRPYTLYGSVSYTVVLVQIGPKFGKLQPVQCALCNKIAGACISAKFSWIFFCILNQIHFSYNCNCGLNNEGCDLTIFRLYCEQIWWLYVKNLQINQTSKLPGCNSL